MARKPNILLILSDQHTARVGGFAGDDVVRTGNLDALADRPEHAARCPDMKRVLFDGFSWEQVHNQIEEDRVRLSEFLSGHKLSTPNQYMPPDGRVFDAEKELYDARWLCIPSEANGGIIPQQFG